MNLKYAIPPLIVVLGPLTAALLTRPDTSPPQKTMSTGLVGPLKTFYREPEPKRVTLESIPTLSSYRTPLSDNLDRTQNIARVADIIDGLTFPPGSRFSFNETVGPRTLERGFAAAPEFRSKTIVKGVGGWVCQTSTTLYVAAMRGRIKVPLCYAHSRPVSYTERGTEAAVSYGSLDLVLENPYPSTLTIRAEVRNGHFEVRFVGREPEYETNFKFLAHFPKPFKKQEVFGVPGVIPFRRQRGEPGISGTGVWIYSKDGKVVDKIITENRYQPVPEVWVVPRI